MELSYTQRRKHPHSSQELGAMSSPRSPFGWSQSALSLADGDPSLQPNSCLSFRILGFLGSACLLAEHVFCAAGPDLASGRIGVTSMETGRVLWHQGIRPRNPSIQLQSELPVRNI